MHQVLKQQESTWPFDQPRTKNRKDSLSTLHQAMAGSSSIHKTMTSSTYSSSSSSSSTTTAKATSGITKTTRTINQRRLSERKSSQELFQQPKLKMLYGKDLKEYDNLNVEDLLGQLSAEELEQLSSEVDPDDSLLPPSQRCKDQTNKDPTGPLKRRQLLNFLTKFAKEQEDWPEIKKFVPGVKLGKVWVPKQGDPKGGMEEKIILDLEDGAEEALGNATEADLVDLAGILGLHSMLNQDQYEASILNKGQPLGDKFESIVKSTKPKKILPPEPDNMTDPEKTAKQVAENDPNLTNLNWNNIKYIPRETFKKLFNGLKTNTNLIELNLSNTGLTDGPAEKLMEALKVNESLRKVNLESNYLSGPMIRDLIEALLDKQNIVEFRAANQRPQIMGNRYEMEIAKLIQQNKTLLKLGLNFDVPDARHKVATQLQLNNDSCRLKRLASVEG
ncbi:tropomodulin isoform X1 [Dermatophagoides farinae]|uniref:tropomodulin isoform X1 n=2 Tax=Dermatophagoides farinae TaxID=6954 RepID=UPI001F0E3997|nr:tropomodulin-like isoform X1 [Dermatophagoides farinae]